MEGFNVRSIVLGIGIGIIITSLVSMIYLSGVGVKMSKDEIITEARKYGMIDRAELIKDDSKPSAGLLPVSNTTPAKNEIEQIKTTQNAINTANSTSSTNIASVTTTAITTIASTAMAAAGPKPESSQNKPKKESDLTIYVNDGDSSEIVSKKLYDKGIIKDKSDFIRKINGARLEAKIAVGEFKFKPGEDVKNIISELTEIR